MRHRLALCVLLVLASVFGVSADDQNEKAVSFVTGAEYRSSYLVDEGIVYHDHPVTQGFVGMSWGSWYFETWGSWSTVDTQSEPYGKEVDFLVQRTIVLPVGFSLDTKMLGIKVFDNYMDSILIPEIILSRAFGAYSTKLSIKRGWVIGDQAVDDGMDGGLVALLGAGRSFDLGKRWRVGLQLDLIRDMQGAFGTTPAWIFQARPSLGLRINGNTSLDLVKLRSTTILSAQDNDPRENRLSYSTGVTLTF